jgi:hypothetical protein
MKLSKAHKALLLVAILSISVNAALLYKPPAQAYTTYNYIIFDTWTNQTTQYIQPQYYGANFTVLLTFNASAYQSYERADLGNVRFFESIPPNQPRPAWIESWSGNTTNDAYTATSVKVWVNLENTGLYASDVWIWMVFFDKATTDFNSSPTIAGWPSASMGEAPQLSPSYGQFDNGADVFLFYDNFAGSTINGAKWNATGASYSVSNGLTFTQNPNYNVLTSLLNVSYGAPNLLYPNGQPEYPAVEYYGSGTSSTSDSGIYYALPSTNTNSSGYLWAQRGSSLANDSLFTYSPPTYTGYANSTYSLDGTKHIYGIMYGPAYYYSTYGLLTYADYAVKMNTTSMPSTYLNDPYFSFRDTVAGTSLSVTWVRERPTPPNGIDFNATVMSAYLTAPQLGVFIDNQKMQEQAVTTYTSPQSFLWNAGDTHNITANNAAGFKFVSWSDGGARSHIITVGSTGVYTATYNGTGTTPIIVQTGQNGGTAAVETVNLTKTVIAGDYILLELSSETGSAVTVTNITDTIGNTFHLINNTVVASYTYAWDYYTVTSAGASDGITITYSTTSQYGYATFATEIAGISGVLGSETGGTSSGNSLSTQSITSPSAPSVMFAFGSQLATAVPTWTAGANYVTSQTGYFGTYAAMADEYNLTWSSSTATTAPVTSTSSSYSWADIVVSLSATPWYYVTFATDGHGSLNQTSDWMVNGTGVTVLASPNANYALHNFVDSVNGNSTANPYSFTVMTNVTVTAYFNLTASTVTVTVATFPSGLANALVIDGVAYTGPQTFSWNFGSIHTLSAVGSINDWAFSSWSDGGLQQHTIIANNSTTITATYLTQSTGGSTGTGNTTFCPGGGTPVNGVCPGIPTVNPPADSNSTITVTPGGSSTTTITIPTGYTLVNSSIESTCPGIDLVTFPAANGTVTVKATAGTGAALGLCKAGIILTLKDAYGRIITQKYLVGVDVKDLLAGPWADWFVFFLLALFIIMILSSGREKKTQQHGA